MELQEIVQTSSDPLWTLNQLQDYFLLIPDRPTPNLLEILAILDPKDASSQLATVLTLYTVKALLYLDEPIKYDKVDQLLRPLSEYSARKPLDSQLSLIKIKYIDLTTDYQYLLSSDAADLKLIELINKKLNFLVSAASSSSVVRDIQNKVLVLYLLCGSDFRKQNIHKYLHDEGIFDREYPAAVLNFVSLNLSGNLIPLEAYTDFTNHLNRLSIWFRAIFKKHSQNFLESFLETNLEKLPNYYKSITIPRIESLLLDGESVVDIEELICKMINGKKLAQDTQIDQLDNIVRFGNDTSNHDPFNQHIKKVCTLVESLAPQS